SHHRSVYTIAGEADAIEAAVLALAARAIASIDMRRHRGEHPRIGALDVVPFIPLGETTMSACIAVPKNTARQLAARFNVPVYRCEEAATDPNRRHLEDIRRGGFEGLPTKMGRDGWRPDFGPSIPHPTAGATVVGARHALVAYNVNLATDRLDVAQRIAAAVR